MATRAPTGNALQVLLNYCPPATALIQCLFLCTSSAIPSVLFYIWTPRLGVLCCTKTSTFRRLGSSHDLDHPTFSPRDGALLHMSRGRRLLFRPCDQSADVSLYGRVAVWKLTGASTLDYLNSFLLRLLWSSAIRVICYVVACWDGLAAIQLSSEVSTSPYVLFFVIARIYSRYCPYGSCCYVRSSPEPFWPCVQRSMGGRMKLCKRRCADVYIAH